MTINYGRLPFTVPKVSCQTVDAQYGGWWIIVRYVVPPVTRQPNTGLYKCILTALSAPCTSAVCNVFTKYIQARVTRPVRVLRDCQLRYCRIQVSL